MAHERALIALLLLATFAGAGDCCGWRAVPIIPDDWRTGGGNVTYYITTLNVYDYFWYLSGTWVVNNRTTASSGVNVSGTNGNTYLTGNNINFDRAGPNYVQATDGSGSLYFGSGGTSDIVGLLNSALTNSLLINGHGVGVYTTADEFEFTVAGAIEATENVSSPLLNTSCIVLAGEEVCSWAAVNGSMSGGSEKYNGTFNETEGTYVYNSTAFLINFNDTLLNLTIDSRIPPASQELDPWWTANESLIFGNLSTVWTWLLSLAADNSTHFTNASIQSGQIAALADYAQANYTAFELNDSLQSGLIADGVTNASLQSGQINVLAGYAQANATADEANASGQSWNLWLLNTSLAGNWTITDLLRGYAQANYTAFEGNDSVQSGQIQNVNDSAVHKFGSEVVAGNKYFTGNVSFTGNVTQYGSDGNRGLYLNDTTGVMRVGNATVFERGTFQVVGQFSSFMRIDDVPKGAIIRGEKAGGTPTAPTAVLGGWNLFGFEAGAWDGTTMSASGGVVFDALTDWNTTSHPASVKFSVTPIDSTTSRNAVFVNGTGIVNLPYQSSVRAYNTSAVSVRISGNITKFTFDAESWDTQGEFATSRFTALQAGTYAVDVQIDFDATATMKIVRLMKSGVIYKEAQTSVSTKTTLVLTDLVQLTAGGYLEVYVGSGDGVTAGRIYGGSENTTISIMKVA